MLYTIIPEEELFTEDTGYGVTQCVEFAGVLMEVLAEKGGAFSVVRLLTTDPLCYLDTRFQPGSTISLSL